MNNEPFMIDEQDIRKLGREGLMVLKSRIELDLAEIKAQIDKAKALGQQGNRADPLWFASVQSAKRFKGQQLQAINGQLSIRREELKAESNAQHLAETLTFGRTFMRVAKRLLNQETYDYIISQTKEEIEHNEKEN